MEASTGRQPTLAEWRAAQEQLAQAKIADATFETARELEVLINELRAIAQHMINAGHIEVARDLAKLVTPGLKALETYETACQDLIFAKQNPDAKVN